MTDWYNDVPAPMDADGEIVPLGVKKLYASNGEALDVELIGFNGRWVIKSDRDGLFNLDWFHLSEPDSWERLEADVERLANCYDVCDYFDATGRKAHDCGNEDGFCCDLCVARDILRRAKAIAVRGKGE